MSRRPIIIIAEKYGRLGNRIFLFAHLIAFAMENKLSVINPAFLDYAHYFDSTRLDVVYRFPPGARKLPQYLRRPVKLCNRIFYRLASKCSKIVRRISNSRVKTFELTDSQKIDLGTTAFLESIRSASLVFLKGWLFRDRMSLERHQDYVREFFRPTRAFQSRIREPIDSLRRDSDIVVGVQIRHGDYDSFAGGRYYYSLRTYSSLMKHTAELFPGKRVSFFVCSEQEQDLNTFRDFPFIFRCGDPIEDMYSLAGCDYLVGPPSTFTRWASFYGKTPLYTVEDPESPFTLESFQQIRG